ncbi:MAG: hypothetical protein IPN17_30090 [Deltaproteobacteria bacterium]|nr:hypothetical protein [Deltaproteobacteria bacterium]MBK8696405.1 hypothetical protein [Deltaproteobacteria bacterium]MBP6831992.1 hypothetical protein [Deltaproteobacteria bacterium]
MVDGLERTPWARPDHAPPSTHPGAFTLRGETFGVRMADDAPAAVVFAAVVERTEARLYEFARWRPGHGEDGVWTLELA